MSIHTYFSDAQHHAAGAGESARVGITQHKIGVERTREAGRAIESEKTVKKIDNTRFDTGQGWTLVGYHDNDRRFACRGPWDPHEVGVAEGDAPNCWASDAAASDC